MIYGGQILAPPYVSSELTRVIRADRATGEIAIADALEKPLPVGQGGTPPAIAKLNGEVVHDISIRNLTVRNYSSILASTSAVLHLAITNVDAPYHTNGNFWAGGFRRFWTMDGLNLVSRGQEFDDDEDVFFRNGSWSVDGDGLGVDEGSSTVVWTGSRISFDEKLCLRPLCDRLHPAAPGALRADLTVSNWRVTNNIIRVNQGLSNALEANWTLLQTGGAIKDYIPRGTLIQGNSIYTNARFGIGFGSPITGAEITNNQINMTVTDGAPVRAVHMFSGNLANNVIQVASPPDLH
jgi:hypothetical protein